MKWLATSIRRSTHAIDQMAGANCNDQIAAKAFGCTHHINPSDWERLCEASHIFATMWKVQENTFENRWMDVLHRLKEAGKVVVLFQEAETAWPLTRTGMSRKVLLSFWVRWTSS